MAPTYIWDPEPNTPRRPQRPSLLERVAEAIHDFMIRGLAST